MDVIDLQEAVGWISLIALGAASVAPFVFWRRFRSSAACVLFLSMAVFVVAILVAQLFPSFGLGRHPETGQQVVQMQNVALHRLLYSVAALAAFVFPAALWTLLSGVVPRPPVTRREARLGGTT
jgi:hypothetical protein